MTPTLEGDFNPQFHFLGLIKKAIGDGIPRRCTVNGGARIVIAPKQMLYYSNVNNIEALQALCQAQPFDLQIEPLPEWDPEAKQESIQVGRMIMKAKTNSVIDGMQPYPLSGLLWYSCLCVSKGHLLEGCRADELIRLKQSPDFSRLPHQDSHVKLAHFMQESSADLLTVSKRTGIVLAQVYDFFNACSILGLIERGNILESEDYFFGLILKVINDGKIRLCSLTGHPSVYLNPVEKKFYSLGDCASLAPYFNANLSDINIEIVDKIDVSPENEMETIQIGRMMVRRKKESVIPSVKPGSLDELLWHSILQVSRGRLLSGRHVDQIVRLKRWPDFARLSKDRFFLPLAAFMSVNSADLSTVAKHTGAPLSQVIDFFNACSILGYVEYLPETRLHRRPIADKDKATYRSISKKLASLRAAQHA